MHKRRKQKYIAAAGANAAQKVARPPRSDRTQAKDRGEIGSGDGHGSLRLARGRTLQRSEARLQGYAKCMKAAVFGSPAKIADCPLRIEEVARPEAGAGQVLLRVLACGVCRTDLHIVEGELPSLRPRLIPGHQIVGEIVGGVTAELALGTHVGVSWIGGTDGSCWYCRNNSENLCDAPSFTGYSVDGGYAEFAAARPHFFFSLSPAPHALF